MISRKTALALSVSALGFMGACAPWESAEIAPTNRADTPEQLLVAEGSWEMIDDKASEPDPIDQHKAARAQVNPADQRKKDYVMPDKVASLSAETSQDVNFRLIRMEKEVAGLRQDFDSLLPPLTKLIVADASLEQTINRLNENKSAANAAPASQAMNSIAPAAGSSPSGVAVQNIRLGDHPGKTRLVMDLSGTSSFKAQIDNTEKILVVDLATASWGLESQKTLNSKIISGFKAQPSAQGGTTVAFELRNPVKITASEALPGGDGQSNRIYIDLSPL
jgi:hypothetical protein